MRSVLFLLIGMMVGGTLGVFFMCLLQINRLSGSSDEE